MRRRRTLGVILAGPPLLGMFATVPSATLTVSLSGDDSVVAYSSCHFHCDECFWGHWGTYPPLFDHLVLRPKQ